MNDLRAYFMILQICFLLFVNGRAISRDKFTLNIFLDSSNYLIKRKLQH